MQVRVADAELAVFKRAAESAGLSLSGWIRDRLKQSARRELRSAVPRATSIPQ